MTDEPVLFDVGTTALAHAGTPVSEPALAYVRKAITGQIDAVVPYVSLFGAHNVLHNYYGFSTDTATQLLTNFLDAQRIHWYRDVDAEATRTGLSMAGMHNIDGWDGYYAHVATETGATTIVTLDDDFERVEGVDVEVLLTNDEFAMLNDHLGY